MRAIIATAGVAFLAVTSAMAQGTCGPNSADVLNIDLIRVGSETVDDHGAKVQRDYGDIGVNNRNVGRFYENPAKAIPAGTYRGLLRYISNHNFVQSSCGGMAITGDFLLEIDGVKAPDGTARSNILLHPGNMPSQSAGCILLGSRKRDAGNNLVPLGPSDPLFIIRREFYGTDNPVACPNKAIVVTVSNAR